MDWSARVSSFVFPDVSCISGLHQLISGSAVALYQSAVLGAVIAKGSVFAISQSIAMGGTCMAVTPWPITVLALIGLGVGIYLLVIASRG